MSAPIPPDESGAHTLTVRRVIAAPAAQLFDAWTQETALLQWWGPKGVRCTRAEIDLRVGGSYQIVNSLPDGTEVLIFGAFETVQPPSKLVYSWQTEPGAAIAERVTVEFVPRTEGTEVVIHHERISDPVTRDRHSEGWAGCLDGLAAFARP